ncbi:hypothetical protein R4K52_04575 [Brachyspira pilosicoli]|uniref:hypothetical protein n=1 Tax=Brachyspira pilosicoli TaxID=52584 RepID=UPI0030040D66
MQLCRKMRDTEIALFWDGNITEDIKLFTELGLIKVVDNYSNGIYERDLYVKVGEYKAKEVFIDIELKDKLGIIDSGYAKGCYKWQNVQLFNWVIFSGIYIFNGAIEDTENAKAKIVSHNSYIENYKMEKVNLTKSLDLLDQLDEYELN